MTTQPEKDRANVRIVPPGIPLVTILAGLALQRFVPLPAPGIPAAPPRYWIGGAIVVAALLGLGLWSVVLFRRSGQDVEPWKPTPSIVERGPFRLTRNPMYLMMVLVCVGFSIILANPWILILTPACAYLLQILAIGPEEAYLERKFGQGYLDYKARVRRWM